MGGLCVGKQSAAHFPLPVLGRHLGRSRQIGSATPPSFWARRCAALLETCAAMCVGTFVRTSGFFSHLERQQEQRAMNWDRVEGNWKEFKGKVQQKWGKLTDDDLGVIEGKRTELSGRLQQRYGVAKDEAERQIDTWLNGVN